MRSLVVGVPRGPQVMTTALPQRRPTQVHRGAIGLHRWRTVDPACEAAASAGDLENWGKSDWGWTWLDQVGPKWNGRKVARVEIY